MAYAEVSDLEDRWRELSEAEQARAEVLLEDASAVLDTLVKVTGDEKQAELLKIVCCNMVERVLSNGAIDAMGVSQQSITAGPYTQSWTFSNPNGDFYLTKMERRLLGITKSYIGSIRPMIGGRHVNWH